MGRPNTGKSTLTNALVGEKIAITADQPETTRHPVRGVVHREKSQIIVVDTPGLHKPRKLIGHRLNDMVAEAYSDVDLIAVAVPADEKIGPGDRWIESVREACPNTIDGHRDQDRQGRPRRRRQRLWNSRPARRASWCRVVELRREPETLIGSWPRSCRGAEVLPVGPRHRRGPRHPHGRAHPRSRPRRTARAPRSVAVQIDEVLPNPDREGVTDVHAVIYVNAPAEAHPHGQDGGRMRVTSRRPASPSSSSSAKTSTSTCASGARTGSPTPSSSGLLGGARRPWRRVTGIGRSSKRHDLGEADRIIVLFTRGHGIVRAVAKGVRRAKSRFGSRLAPFVDVDVQIHPGRNLGTITGADAVRTWAAPIVDDYARYTCACGVLETAERLAGEEGTPSPGLWDLTVDALDALAHWDRGRPWC